MTTRDTFGRDLSLWLREEGEHRVPDHLAEVLVRSACHPPATVVVEPRKVAPRGYRRSRTAPQPAAARDHLGGHRRALACGARRDLGRQPAAVNVRPGLERPDLRRLTARCSRATRPAVGTHRSCVISRPARSRPSISPDGRSIAYIMDTLQRVDIVDIENGTRRPSRSAASSASAVRSSWSPDGTIDCSPRWTQFTVVHGLDCRLESIVDATGDRHQHAQCRRLPRRLWPAGWSPTGDRVAFVAARCRTEARGRSVRRPRRRQRPRSARRTRLGRDLYSLVDLA